MTIILAGPNDYLSYELFIKKSVFTIKYLALDPTILAIDDPILREQQLLKKNKAKSGSNFNFIIHINAVERFLHDLLESNIPFETERVKFLFQNFLFGFRNIGFNWNMYPQPLVYNSGARLITYMAGYRLNLRKISHWSIPQFIETFLNKLVGLEGRLFVFVGDSLANLSSSKSLHASLIEFDNGQLISFKNVSAQELTEIHTQVNQAIQKHQEPSSIGKASKQIIYDRKTALLREYRIALSRKFKFINHVIWINENLLDKIINTIILQLNSRSLWVLKELTTSLDLLKDPNFFAVVPDHPGMNVL